MTEMNFPEGFYWGEKAWEAFARPCQILYELCELKYRQGVQFL